MKEVNFCSYMEIHGMCDESRCGAPSCINRNKPPLGLIPKKTHDELRRNGIADALRRYTAAGKTIPLEWIEEYNELSKS